MSTTTETHYDLLCISPDATAEELKVAYRRLIRTYHPDIAGAHGEAMSKRINSAWSELSDPAKRSSYDFSIRPQPVYEEPAPQAAYAPQRPTAQPASDHEPQPASDKRPRRAKPAPEPAPEVDAEPTFYYFPAKHRGWTIAFVLLLTAFVGAALTMNAEWIEPTVAVTGWRTIPGLAAPIAFFVLLSSKTDKYKSGFYLWFASLIWPLGLLGWWPFAGISDGIAPLTLIAMTALTPMLYLTRFAWRHMRQYSSARKFLKESGQL